MNTLINILYYDLTAPALVLLMHTPETDVHLCTPHMLLPSINRNNVCSSLTIDKGTSISHQEMCSPHVISGLLDHSNPKANLQHQQSPASGN